MPELLQFGDQSGYYSTVDLALTEAFIFSSVASAGLSMPCIDRDSYSVPSSRSVWTVNMKDKFIIASRRIPSHSILYPIFLGNYWVFLG